MKYRLFHIEERNMGSWISIEQFGLNFTVETDSDIQLLNEMKDWCSDQGIWMISDLVYLDSFEERVEFILRWL